MLQLTTTYAIVPISKLLLRQSTTSSSLKYIKICHIFGIQNNQFTRIRSMSSSPFLQVLATSVSATNKAGDLIRDIMYKGQLDIVEKTGADDLQVRYFLI